MGYAVLLGWLLIIFGISMFVMDRVARKDERKK